MLEDVSLLILSFPEFMTLSEEVYTSDNFLTSVNIIAYFLFDNFKKDRYIFLDNIAAVIYFAVYKYSYFDL